MRSHLNVLILSYWNSRFDPWSSQVEQQIAFCESFQGHGRPVHTVTTWSQPGFVDIYKVMAVVDQFTWQRYPTEREPSIALKITNSQQYMGFIVVPFRAYVTTFNIMKTTFIPNRLERGIDLNLSIR